MDEQLKTSVQEVERLSASFKSEALAASISSEELLAVVVSDSEALEGSMRALGVERYYNGAVGFAAISGEEALSALRCVAVFAGFAFLLSSNDPDGANRCSGVTMTAAERDAELVVLSSGVLEDASWSWQDGKEIYCGPDGRLTQTPPETGFSQIVAIPLSPTKILLKINEAITL